MDMNGDGIPDMEVTIDGMKVKTKDLFPDAAARQDFHTKLKLLKSPTSGEDDGMTGAEALDDFLFSGKKSGANKNNAAKQEPDGR